MTTKSDLIALLGTLSIVSSVTCCLWYSVFLKGSDTTTH